MVFFLWFYVQELPKAQLAVVLVLKRLRRRVHGLKSHPTDWEKPGIEPATPGLQGIALIHYTTGASLDFVCTSCINNVYIAAESADKIYALTKIYFI